MRLAIVTLGHVHSENLAPLTYRFEHLEQLVLDVPPRDDLTKHRAELNRAIDAPSTDWILIVRERETIDETLSGEIALAVRDAKAWGFRIRSTPLYSGKTLKIGETNELRLFHRRHLLRRGDLAVQGTVVRLAHPLRSVTFATPDEHRQHLAKIAAPHSAVRRALLFVRYVLSTRAHDANTLRYLWIEAAYDVPL